MNFNRMYKQTKLFLKHNMPTILTVLGVAGVGATVVVSSKSALKAKADIDAKEAEKKEELTTAEKLKITGKAYIPTFVVAGATSACIIGSDVLNVKRISAINAAYMALNATYQKLIDNVRENTDAETYAKIMTAKERDILELRDPKSDKALFYDEFYDEYFEAYPEDVIVAESDINRYLNAEGYVYVNDFYEALGLPRRPDFGELGWACNDPFDDDQHLGWVNFYHEPVEIDSGLECYVITYDKTPYII